MVSGVESLQKWWEEAFSKLESQTSRSYLLWNEDLQSALPVWNLNINSSSLSALTFYPTICFDSVTHGMLHIEILSALIFKTTICFDSQKPLSALPVLLYIAASFIIPKHSGDSSEASLTLSILSQPWGSICPPSFHLSSTHSFQKHLQRPSKGLSCSNFCDTALNIRELYIPSLIDQKDTKKNG